MTTGCRVRYPRDALLAGLRGPVAREGMTWAVRAAPTAAATAPSERNVRSVWKPAHWARMSRQSGGRVATDQLLTNLRTPVPLRVTVEDAEYRSGPDDGCEIGLRTTRFEALRWRTGRRSRAQLVAMDWSGDPTPVLDHLYLFGPAHADIVE